MSSKRKILAFVSVFTFAFLLGIVEQAGAHFSASRTEGWKMAQALERVSGTVIKVDNISQPNRSWTGMHLSLRTIDQVLDVMLGPSDYIESQGVSLQAGDRVTVSGVRTGTSGMIAYEVQKGDQILRLRTESGVPLWAGRGRRP